MQPSLHTASSAAARARGARQLPGAAQSCFEKLTLESCRCCFCSDRILQPEVPQALRLQGVLMSELQLHNSSPGLWHIVVLHVFCDLLRFTRGDSAL